MPCVAAGFNAPGKLDSPYLVLVSIDGFGSGYQARYETPALDRLAARGVRAKALRPVFPTLTFPNHYSIATGLYPAEHGIVGNDFPDEQRTRWYSLWDRNAVEDGSWYNGEPVWVVAEQHGLVTAAYYFVGTEAAIQGVSPTYWHRYDETVPGEDRVDQVLEWLSMPVESRPHVVTLYFEDVDDAGHEGGPGTALLAAAIRQVDGYVGRLLDGIAALELADQVYVVVVSDHGQSAYVDAGTPFIIADVLDLDGLKIIDGGSYASIYLAGSDSARALAIRDAINESWNNGRAYLRAETPAAWRVDDNPRFPDVFVVADPGHAVLSQRDRAHRIKPGDHGWAPEFRDMHGIFVAAGPRLPRGTVIGEISVVDVYPMMIEVLGIDADGHRAGPLVDVLKRDD